MAVELVAFDLLTERIIGAAIDIPSSPRTAVGSYRLELVVENCVVVEIESVAALAPVHQAQTLTSPTQATLTTGC